MGGALRRDRQITYSKSSWMPSARRKDRSVLPIPPKPSLIESPVLPMPPMPKMATRRQRSSRIQRSRVKSSCSRPKNTGTSGASPQSRYRSEPWFSCLPLKAFDKVSETVSAMSFHSKDNLEQISSKTARSTGLPVRKLLTVDKASANSSANARWLGNPCRLIASFTTPIKS